MKRLLIATLALALAGCATQVLEGYVGKPIQSVMIERGMPSMILDLPGGRRAYQWTIVHVGVMPTTTYGQVNIYAPPGAFAQANYSQTTTGGQMLSDTCRYTLYARWDARVSSWMVESFEKPSWMCEAG